MITGEVFSQLEELFIKATRESLMYKGTPLFFQKRNLLLHIAFDEFARTFKEGSSTLRDRLINEAKMYPQFRTLNFSAFANSLPDEFNVRGIWTSRYTLVKLKEKK